MQLTATPPMTMQDRLNQQIREAYNDVEKGYGETTALEHLLAQAEALVYPQAVADIRTLLAWQYYLDSMYEVAIKTALTAAAQYEEIEDNGLRTLLYGVLGAIYTRTGAYHESLRYFYRQREVSEAHKDVYQLANANIGLAAVYSDIGEHERALEHDNAALELFRQLNERERMATVYMQMCHSYSEAGHYADALEAGHGGLALCINDRLGRIKGWLLYNMAIPLARLGELQAGLNSGLQALKIARNRDDLLLTTLTHVSIGRCYALLNDVQLAQQHFELALGLSTQLGTKRIAYEAHDELAKLCKARGDVHSALLHYEQYMALHHDLFGEEVVTKLRNQEILRQTEASQREADVAREVSLELERRVTERTAQLEEALRREQQLARDLKQAFDQQEQLNKLQSKIISTVSHAFRTPMTVIGASADLLEKFHERMTVTKRKTQFARIRTAIEDLTGMLQDAMMVSAVNTANVTLNWEKMAFGDVCSKLETQLRQEGVANTSVRFEYIGDTAELVRADFHWLKQIMFNLIANALKYSHDDAQVNVSIALNKRYMRICVVDDGLGIPPDEIDGLFQLFVRGSNVESRRGLGLGLYTVRRLVEAMGGAVSAESPGINRGSTFTVTLPTVLVE